MRIIHIFLILKKEENLDIKWNFWILCKILKIEEIHIEDNYKIFYDLFDDEDKSESYEEEF